MIEIVGEGERGNYWVLGIAVSQVSEGRELGIVDEAATAMRGWQWK